MNKKKTHKHIQKGIGAVARQAEEPHSRSGPERRPRDRDLGRPIGDEREPHRRDGEGRQLVGEGAAPTAAADAAATGPLDAFHRAIQSGDSGAAAHGHSVLPTGGGGGGGPAALP